MKNAVWIIVVVLLAGLGLVWLATGGQGNGINSDATSQESSEVPNDFRTSARVGVEALEAQFEAGGDANLIAEAVAAIRADLALAYENAGEDAQIQWEDAEASLKSLEASLREGASDVLDRFVEVSLRLTSRI